MFVLFNMCLHVCVIKFICVCLCVYCYVDSVDVSMYFSNHVCPRASFWGHVTCMALLFGFSGAFSHSVLVYN